jgi:hypothetical protein
MKLDLSVVKNESVVKFDKSLKAIKKNFENDLFLALSSANNCMNKASSLV